MQGETLVTIPLGKAINGKNTSFYKIIIKPILIISK